MLSGWWETATAPAVATPSFRNRLRSTTYRHVGLARCWCGDAAVVLQHGGDEIGKLPDDPVVTGEGVVSDDVDDGIGNVVRGQQRQELARLLRPGCFGRSIT